MKIQPGNLIKAIHKETGEIVIGRVISKEGLSVRNNQVSIITPDYQEKIISLLEFIVKALPLIEAIGLWFKSIFKRKNK